MVVVMLGGRCQGQVSFCRNASLILADPVPVQEADTRTSIVDHDRGFVYIPFIGPRIVIVDLHDFERVPGYVDTAPLEDFLSGFLDSSTGRMYLTTSIEGDIVVYDVATTPGSPQLVMSASLRTGLSPVPLQAFFFEGVLDPDVPDTAYFVEVSGYIARVQLSTLTVEASLLQAGLPKLRTIAIDGPRRTAWVGSLNAGSGAVVLRVNLTTFAVDDTIDFVADQFVTALVDDALGYVFFSSSYLSSSIVRVQLAPPYGISRLGLDAGDELLISVVYDRANQRALYGTDVTVSSQSRVIQVDLAAFARDGAVVMDDNEVTLVAGFLGDAASATDDFAYFTCRYTGRMVRLLLRPPSCGAHTDCDSCNAGCGCGWCAGTQTCLAGDPRGDTGGVCPVGTWDYLDCANCNALSDSCESCLSNPLCGFCAEVQQCTRGSAAGAYTPGVCTDLADWDYASCPACSAHTTCDNCTAAVGCGWCPERQTCERGDDAASFEGACPSWRPDVCLNCTAVTAGDCTTCAATDAYCGFCETTGACLPGNATGSFLDTPDACTEADAWTHGTCLACASHTNCSTCGADPRCGWCAGSQTCLAGNAAGPHPGASGASCPADWTWTDAGCIACAGHADCTACAGAAGCGWCAATETCERGNLGGSYLSVCPSWTLDTCRTCGALSGQGNCAACLASDSHCGFCATSFVCAEGDAAAGPYASSGGLVGACGVGASLVDWDTNPAAGGTGCRQCAQHATCDACASDARCGWCYDDWTCKAGDAAGAFGSGDDACAEDAWEWDGSCPAICTGATCGECTADARCGWCAETQTCLPGNDDGPHAGATCGASGGSWRMDCSLCAGTTCGDCRGDWCGWCQAGVDVAASCLPGDAAGPFAGWDACPAGVDAPEDGWYHGTDPGSGEDGSCTQIGFLDACGIDVANVTAAGGAPCEVCVAQSAGCVWCPATRACYQTALSRCPREGIRDCSYGWWYVFVLALLLVVVTCAGAGLLWWCIRSENIARQKRRARATADALARRQADQNKANVRAQQARAQAQALAGQSQALAGQSQALAGQSGHAEALAGLDDVALQDMGATGATGAAGAAGESAGAGGPTEGAPAEAEVTRQQFFLSPPPYVVLGAHERAVSDHMERVLEDLEQLLGDPSQCLANALCKVVRVGSGDGDDVARALVCAFYANGSDVALDLVKGQVSREVRQTIEQQSNAMLRGNSMASKMMSELASIVGLRYLFALLRGHVLQQCKSERSVVPESAEAPVDALLEAVDAIFTDILEDTAGGFPPELVALCQHLTDEVGSVFPQLSSRAVASFVFLRFINPALCSPIHYGLVERGEEALEGASLDATAQSNLVAVSKVLQAIANKAPFKTRNLHLAGCNEYVRRGVTAFERWVSDVVARVPSARADDTDVHVQVVDPHTIWECVVNLRVPPHVRREALLSVYEMCARYMEELRVELSAAELLRQTRASERRRLREKPFDRVRRQIMTERVTVGGLTRMLVERGFALVSALCEVAKQEEHQDLCGALLVLFVSAETSGEAEGPTGSAEQGADGEPDARAQAREQQFRVLQPALAMTLVKVLAEREMRHCVEANLVFRSFHVAARTMIMYSTMVGGAWRRRLLSEVVEAVCTEPWLYDIAPAAAGDNLKANVFRLLDLVGTLLETVFNGLEGCPMAFRSIAAHLQEIVRAQFPDKWFLGPGRFFFTHFICEGLEHPQKHGMVVEAPSPEAKRVLHSINRIVIHMVNDMLFAVEHRYVRALNEFVQNNVPVMRGFLVELARIPEHARVTPTAAPFLPEQENSAAAYITSRLLYYIANADFVYQYHFFLYIDSEQEEEEALIDADDEAWDEVMTVETSTLLALEEIIRDGEALLRPHV